MEAKCQILRSQKTLLKLMQSNTLLIMAIRKQCKLFKTAHQRSQVQKNMTHLERTRSISIRAISQLNPHGIRQIKRHRQKLNRQDKYKKLTQLQLHKSRNYLREMLRLRQKYRQEFQIEFHLDKLKYLQEKISTKILHAMACQKISKTLSCGRKLMKIQKRKLRHKEILVEINL